MFTWGEQANQLGFKLGEEPINLGRKLRQFVLHDVPNNPVIDIVIAMNQPVSKPDHHGRIRDFAVPLRSLFPKTDTSLPDDLKFTLHRRSGFRIRPVARQVHTAGKVADLGQSSLNIVNELLRLRRHTPVDWSSPPSGETRDFSGPDG